jgi:hypothetical protein
VAGLRGGHGGQGRNEGDAAAVTRGEGGGEAGERDQVTHAGAGQEHDVRRASL